MLSSLFGFGRANFETYMSHLLRDSSRGAPTADEARRDYRAASTAVAGIAVWPRSSWARPRDGQRTSGRLAASN